MAPDVAIVGEVGDREALLPVLSARGRLVVSDLTTMVQRFRRFRPFDAKIGSGLECEKCGTRVVRHGGGRLR